MVCRAENSFTHRHLCEFTGLDFEMAINEHYSEVMDVIDKLFVYIFNGLNAKYGKAFCSIRLQERCMACFITFFIVVGPIHLSPRAGGGPPQLLCQLATPSALLLSTLLFVSDGQPCTMLRLLSTQLFSQS